MRIRILMILVIFSSISAVAQKKSKISNTKKEAISSIDANMATLTDLSDKKVESTWLSTN